MVAMTLSANLSLVDANDFNKVVDAFKQNEMNRAVRAFLKACLARIPVRTGFLKGAFTEINSYFGSQVASPLGSSRKRGKPSTSQTLKTLFGSGSSRRQQEARSAFLQSEAFKRGARRLALRRKAQGQRGRSNVDEYYYDGGAKVLKTPTSGIPYTTPPDQVLITTDNRITFFLDVNISYFAANDTGFHGSGTPWQAVDAGVAAMVGYLEESINRFPKIEEIATTLNIKTTGTSVTTSTQKPDISRFLTITPGA